MLIYILPLSLFPSLFLSLVHDANSIKLLQRYIKIKGGGDNSKLSRQMKMVAVKMTCGPCARFSMALGRPVHQPLWLFLSLSLSLSHKHTYTPRRNSQKLAVNHSKKFSFFLSFSVPEQCNAMRCTFIAIGKWRSFGDAGLKNEIYSFGLNRQS